jgi:hypothetical protein
MTIASCVDELTAEIIPLVFIWNDDLCERWLSYQGFTLRGKNSIVDNQACIFALKVLAILPNTY